VKFAVALTALTLVCAGCGGSSGSDGLAEATPPVAKRLLTARLRAHFVAFKWVACIRTGREFRGVPVVRCNVNFGDPHIEAYCSVLRNGRLVTDHDDAAIPCRHDDAGPPATIVHS
jgi:hypothetical protein